jgi:hypothetical protein
MKTGIAISKGPRGSYYAISRPTKFPSVDLQDESPYLSQRKGSRAPKDVPYLYKPEIHVHENGGCLLG